MANYPLGKGITKDVVLTALKYLGGASALAGGAELLKTKKDLEKANKAKEIITNEYIDSKNREFALDKALRAARLKDMTRTGAFGTIGGGTLGGLGGYGITSLVTKNKLLRALGALAGGAAGALGGNYWAYKDYDSKYASQDSNSKNSELALDDALRDARLENEITRAIRGGFGTIGGGLLGGLGGYGLTGLMTKNKWLRALGVLGGVVGGGIGGSYLADKYASTSPKNNYGLRTAEDYQNELNRSGFYPKHITIDSIKKPEDVMNALINQDYYSRDNVDRKVTNAEEMENKINNELDINNIKANLARKARLRSILYGAGGATLGGLGGLGLTSLLTDNKWLRALGTLAGAGVGGYGGYYLKNKYAKSIKKRASQYDSYEAQKGLLKALGDTNDELNAALAQRDLYKNSLGAIAGGALGGLGGYGLTSLMTKNKWLRALGALGGVGVGGYFSNGSKVVDTFENGVNKLKTNQYTEALLDKINKLKSVDLSKLFKK